MARTEISMLKTSMRNIPSTAVGNSDLLKALDASDGGAVLWDRKDDFVTVVVQNSATADANVTIKSGDGPDAMGDLTVAVKASSTICLSLDSARFKVTKGTDKGKILFAGPATMKVAVFCTP